MSLLDLILAAVVGTSILAGLKAGFARAGFGFAAAVIGILVGFWFYRYPAAFFSNFVDSPAIMNVLGFLLLFSAVTSAGALVGKLSSKFFKWTGLSWLDRVLGAGFGLVRGALIAAAMVAVLMAFVPRPLPNWMVGSRLLPYAMSASDIAASMAPEGLKQAFTGGMLEIRQAWAEEVNRARRRVKSSSAEDTDAGGR